jgi:hypothetical protein
MGNLGKFNCFCVARTDRAFWNENCTMTNVMHTFLIYVSIYFCLKFFGLSFSPSSGAGVQFSWVWCNGGGLVISHLRCSGNVA